MNRCFLSFFPLRILVPLLPCTKLLPGRTLAFFQTWLRQVLNKLLDLLVPVSLMYLYTYTSGLSPRRLQGVLLFSDGISLLEVGFTLRCLQRLSLPDLATLL